MVVGLATPVADPVERLRMIHSYAVAGKNRLPPTGTAHDNGYQRQPAAADAGRVFTMASPAVSARCRYRFTP